MKSLPKKLTSLPRILSSCAPRIFKVAGWIVAIFLFYSLLSDWEKALKFPAPHQYGEGILVWMTREVDNGKWPYGDILDSPSRYSCYAPMVPALASVVSRVIPRSQTPQNEEVFIKGIEYVYAGRLISYSSWIAASILLALASAQTRQSRVAVGLMFLSAVSLHSFFWTLRVDSTVIALQALFLFILVRCHPRHWKILLPLSVTLLTLTKPTAVVDLVPLTILALALRNCSPKNFIKVVWKPILYSILIAPSVFFSLDIFSGMWMSNNILREQLGSGSMSGQDFGFVITSALFSKEMGPVLFWSLLSVAAFVPAGRLKLLAAALSLLLCSAFATKSGADVNYYFPLIAILCSSAGSYLNLVPGHAPFAILVTGLIVLPLDHSPHHRQPYAQKAEAAARVNELRSIHNQDNFLTEDPFFSVLAGRDPLTVDIFQLSRSAARDQKDASNLSCVASGAWGGGRLRVLMARDQEFSLEETASPMPTGHIPDAVWVKEISKFPPPAPPQKNRWSNIKNAFVEKGLIPSIVLLLLASVPTRCSSRSWRNWSQH